MSARNANGKMMIGKASQDHLRLARTPARMPITTKAAIANIAMLRSNPAASPSGIMPM